MKFVHGWTAVNSTQQQQEQQEQPKRFFNSAGMGGMAMDLSGRRLIPKLLRLPIPGSVLVLDKDTLRKNLNTAVLQMRNKQFMGRHPTTTNSLDHGQSFWNGRCYHHLFDSFSLERLHIHVPLAVIPPPNLIQSWQFLYDCSCCKTTLGDGSCNFHVFRY
ncbi:hypothetical protein IV203_000066 [Nitzschia inconspicua]|uniref:Uncharacterized protein n=1 Tax=Nitzschia inconspicua TaxID=303405 RepID=A0A9K3L5U2_9STRA|nr:hypothetical protein IV203_000066 [Nitzschia inconspicua]